MQRLRGGVDVLSSAVVRWALAGLCPAAQAQGLTLHHHDRLPYSFTWVGGAAASLEAPLAAQALGQAGVPFASARTPSRRQPGLIQGGAGLHSNVGWFRNPQRVALVKLGKPLFSDKPFFALARHGSRQRSGLRGAEVPALDTMLLKDGCSCSRQTDRRFVVRTPAPGAWLAGADQALAAQAC